MKRLESLLRKPLLLLLLAFLLLEFLPVFGKNAELRLYESCNFRHEYTTRYALQANGDLISWGDGPLDRSPIGEYRSLYPYFMRRKIARNVTDFACTLNAILYVDKNHVLRGSGSDADLLRGRGFKRVWLMADVERVVVDANRLGASTTRVLVLKTDGSVWTWQSRDYSERDRKRGAGADDTEPEKIADNIRAIFLVNGSFFAVTNEDVLLHWKEYEYGEAETIAQNVEAVSSLYLGGRMLDQYLSRQGEVYTITVLPSMKAAEKPIADNVTALCEDGFIRADHSLWTWQGTSENGAPVKTLGGVQTAKDSKLYTDRFGRLHWRSTDLQLRTLPQPVRWLDPDSRKMEMVFLCAAFLLWLLHKLTE